MTNEEYLEFLRDWISSEPDERRKAVLMVAEGVESENAKLRELVLMFRDYTAKCTHYTHSFGYGDCAFGPFPDGVGCGNCCHVKCAGMSRNDLDKQLRELGVEVR